MKNLINTTTIASLLLVTLLLISAPASAQQAISDGIDIAKLMALAQSNFDMTKQDAVILFEGKKLYWLPDGRLIDFVHEIIWINTDYAINTYADHRIPYDSKRCDFHVVTVRTWRDNQWWETGETGIVETLPENLKPAYDYTNIREMMLLHNGVELPCILEVAYYIEDKVPFRKGIDGIWTFAKADPVVWSWFGYGAAPGTMPQTNINGGISESEKQFDDKYGVDVHWWKTDLLKPTSYRYEDNPSAEITFIAYSSWKDWSELGSYLADQFNTAAVVDSQFQQAVDSVTAEALSPLEEAESIIEYANNKVAPIDYDNRYWVNIPRPAVRTFATAYGHSLDKTILTMALLKAAGFKAEPIYISKAYGENYPDIPTTAAMGIPRLRIQKDQSGGLYDASTQTIVPAELAFYNHLAWVPGIDKKPTLYIKYSDEAQIDLKLNLEYDSENGKLTGKGILSADNSLCPYDKTMGVNGEMEAYLNKVISSVISKANITEYNPVKFNPLRIQLAFKFETAKLEPDDFDRFSFTMGKLSGGIFDLLPKDIRLANQIRYTVINLPEKLSQNIELTLKLEGLDLIYAPDNLVVANTNGTFDLKISKSDKKLILSRSLKLDKTTYQSGDWPELKKLLLAETDKNNGMVIFKTEGDKDKKE